MSEVLPFANRDVRRMAEDRRRSPRIDSEGRLTARDLGSGLSLHVLDISLGGCLVAARAPLPEASTRVFVFDLPFPLQPIRLRVRVVYRNSRGAFDRGRESQVMGVAFLEPDVPAVMADIDRLVAHASGILDLGPPQPA
jgi:PilZ domain